MALKVYDTLRARKEEFEPVSPGKVGIYFCGMTVQDRPHIGHMLAFVAGDMIRRHLRFKGYDVKYIQNFTDIDDKIIAKANEEGVDYRVIAERNMKEYFRYADELNILKADAYPLATQHIAEIVSLIGALVDKGFAYDAGGDVYFRVRALPAVREALEAQRRRARKRRAHRGRGAEGGSARLHPLEGGEGGGTRVGKPLGARTPRLAHRVLGDVDEVSRDHDRYARRRPGSHFPPSRERDRAERGGDGEAVYPLLDAQRPPEPPRREDVEVDGAFLRDRGHQPGVHGRGDPVLSPFDPFPQRHRVQPRAAEGGRGGPRTHPERVRLRRRTSLGARRRSRRGRTRARRRSSPGSSRT